MNKYQKIDKQEGSTYTNKGKKETFQNSIK